MADQSKSFKADVFHRYRAAFILILLFVVANQNGCSSARPAMKSLWQQVPPVRWSSKASQSATASTEKVTEPAVAANVAIKSNDAGPAEAADDFAWAETRTKSPLSRLTTRFSRPEHESNEGPSTFETVDFAEPNSKPMDDHAEGTDSPLDRLNAALSDDALQAQSLPQHSVTMLEERIRVNSLVSRANRLIENGQLQQAKEAAVLAQAVGDAAQLDYSPDEDRPIDLIRRIDGQLEAIRIADQSGSDEQNPADQNISETEIPAASEGVTPSNSLEEDLKVLTRKNRNWSAFFRREKKSSVTLSEPGSQGPATATLGPPASVRDDFRSVSRSTRSAPHDAVVMANRSVSLGPVEPAGERSISTDTDPFDQKTSAEDSSGATVPNSTDFDTPRFRSNRVVSFAVSSHSTRTTIEPDEGSGELPEFDSVETVSPTHEVETETDDEPSPPKRTDSTEPIRPADGTFFYLTIGVCTVLAVICYRRGAT